MIVLLVALIPGTYILHSLFCLFCNYRHAQKSGFPVVALPAHEMNPLYLIWRIFCLRIVAWLPFGLGKHSYWNFVAHDWPFHTRYRQFAEWGECILSVNPKGNTLYIADADVAEQVYTRYRDFTKDTRLYDWVRFYGDNVLTTEGKEWSRHRRVTGPPFNETMNARVWKETTLQGLSLLKAWTYGNEAKGSFIVNHDFNTVTRNIISAVGFGVSLPFEPYNPEPTPEWEQRYCRDNADFTDDRGDDRFDTHFALHTYPAHHKISYGDALDTLLENVLLIVLLPKLVLKYGPGIIGKTGLAYDSLGVYLRELLERERNNREKGFTNGSKTLLSALAAQNSDSDLSEKTQARLTEDELLGNLFIFAVAGMETTAGTLQYILYLLALHPEAQEWFQNELAKDLQGQSSNPTKWKFEEVWPKLASPLCVINETLRIFGTHQVIPKWTADKPQTLRWKNQTCYLDPGTTVFVCLRGLHDNPNYWGDQTYGFHPEAWDGRNPDTVWRRTDPRTGAKVPLTAEKDQETKQKNERAPFCFLRPVPVKSSYAPFSDGVRSCLGRNFALIEMTLILAILFSAKQDQRLEIARKEGETKEDAIKRGWEAMKNSSQMNTLMIRKDIPLCWVKKE